MKKLFTAVFIFNVLVISAQNKPNLFLEEQISIFPNVRDIAMHQKSGEAIFSVQNYTDGNSVLVQVKKNDGKWQKPEILPFSGRYNDLEPFFSKDGLKLYFASNRPINTDEDKSKDFDIWVVERENVDREWQNPTNLGKPINTELDEFYPVITESGNIYFTSVKEKENKDDIFVSELVDGKYLEPYALSPSINTVGYEFNAFIAPDESFILFTGYGREDGFGSGDIYISYSDDGDWGKAKNLGELINSDKMDYCPFVDIETEILYFTSKRLNHNTTKQPLTLNDILEWKEKADGLSKLYKVDFSQWMNKNNN